jgi:hypothetical protein
VRVWFDKWAIRPGQPIPLAIEEGLQSSRTLILLMSAASVGSEWVSVERHTILFRDPTNQQRRFIPVLIERCEDSIPEMLRIYRHIDMCRFTQQAYTTLLGACHVPGTATVSRTTTDSPNAALMIHHLDDEPTAVEFMPEQIRLGAFIEHPKFDCSPWDLEWDEKILQASFDMPTPVGQRLIRYRIYPDIRSFGEAIRWLIQPSDIVILDVMIMDESGTFLNAGIEALELVSKRVTTENIFILTGYREGIPERARGLLPQNNVFDKPFGVRDLVASIVKRLGVG